MLCSGGEDARDGARDEYSLPIGGGDDGWPSDDEDDHAPGPAAGPLSPAPAAAAPPVPLPAGPAPSPAD